MDRHPRDTARKGRPGQDEKPDRERKGAPGRGPARGKAGEDKAPVKLERIAKRLARAGVASRREVERLVGLGKVAVNGRILDTPAVLVGKDDQITVEGRLIDAPQATRVWRYHKPVGLLTTHRDPEGRPTVFENLPEGLPRVISVGRLDINSEGLLLLTNDGELARALELPASGWVRRYRARARGKVTQARLDELKDGVTVDGVHYGPIEATLDKAKEGGSGANLWITVAITEGKNREVRRVLESLGLHVNRLIRLAYGPFQLGTLESGAVEEVGPRVIREQLADLIAPENLPQGDAVATPPARPGRRIPTSALSDASKKPSRVRAAVARREAAEAEAPRESAAGRPKPRPGWAKAAPGRGGDDRPRRAGPPRDRARAEGDRPQRPYKPRAEGVPDRARRDDDRPQRAFRPRPDGAPDRPRQADGDRPKRPYKPREGGDAERPRKPGPGGGYKGGPKSGPRSGPRSGAKAGPGGGAKFGPRPGGRPGGPRSGGPRPGGKPRGPGGPRSGG